MLDIWPQGMRKEVSQPALTRAATIFDGDTGALLQSLKSFKQTWDMFACVFLSHRVLSWKLLARVEGL